MKKIGKRTKGRSWILVGIILSAVLIGVSGCGAKDTIADPTPSSQQTALGQENQGQAAQQRASNPAVEAAMSIRRLQANEEMVLTGDQKEEVKPILQSLIDTADPSQTFLQEKADAMTAIFTDEQKTYLSTNTPKGSPKGNDQNERPEPRDKPNTQSNEQGGDPNRQAGVSSQPQDIFKQVLDSLT
ncbi:hypothetical protein [Desulfosporosinus shakirovi]|uniref:hypothetical protein n=1 Tax=Desulfosporosinus shakirovi TaxID=2885154 RepID=UPI001E2C964C|nr:hypothetical protein [Desulfosporosinus sp. SRJS8]MCB8817521.1 hypothetical protein [Desulfosporosinus sp. SRJS8]